MKYILILIIFLNFLYAKKVNIDIKADYFDLNKQKNIILFKGNVSMIKAKDTLLCDEVTLKTNKTEIKSYIAIGNVSFRFLNKKNKSLLIGKGDKVTYDMNKEIYEIIGNGYLEDTLSKKIIRGENIYINEKTGQIKIKGTKDKPVQFRFVMEEK